MDSNSSDLLLKKKRIENKRRNRVRTIRNILYGSFFVLVLTCAVSFIYMLYTVRGLSHRIDELTLNQQLIEQKLEEQALKKKAQSMLNVVEITPEEVAVEEEAPEPEAVVSAEELEDAFKVYLTFDDGPSDTTDRLLDLLDDYGIKATFFVTGKNDEESMRRMKRIVDEGHTIAMHTYTHSYNRIYESIDTFSEDVQRIHDLIYEATGVDCHYYRFPGGSSNSTAGRVKIQDYISYLNDKEIRYYDWNVSSGDAAFPSLTSEQIVENIMRDVVKYKSSIVLMHDAPGKGSTLEALPTVIEKIRAEGAIILPIDDNTSLVQHVKGNQ